MGDEETPKPLPPSSKFGMMTGLMLFTELTGLIISPLIVLGVLGYFVAKYEFGGSKWVLIIFVLIAFGCSNLLVIHKAGDLVKKRLK